jgi:hypothetical protein
VTLFPAFLEAPEGDVGREPAWRREILHRPTLTWILIFCKTSPSRLFPKPPRPSG